MELPSHPLLTRLARLLAVEVPADASVEAVEVGLRGSLPWPFLVAVLLGLLVFAGVLVALYFTERGTLGPVRRVAGRPRARRVDEPGAEAARAAGEARPGSAVPVRRRPAQPAGGGQPRPGAAGRLHRGGAAHGPGGGRRQGAPEQGGRAAQRD